MASKFSANKNMNIKKNALKRNKENKSFKKKKLRQNFFPFFLSQIFYREKSSNSKIN